MKCLVLTPEVHKIELTACKTCDSYKYVDQLRIKIGSIQGCAVGSYDMPTRAECLLIADWFRQLAEEVEK